jgi:hypothetical protein
MSGLLNPAMQHHKDDADSEQTDEKRPATVASFSHHSMYVLAAAPLPQPVT